MAIVWLITRLVLSAVFLVSGGAKLFDPDGTKDAFGSFGVPTSWHRWGAVILPVVELVVGVALVPEGSAWLASWAAVVLLAVFTATVGWAMAQGRRPDCHCFGQLGSTQVGPTTLVLNAVLLAGAAGLAHQGRGAVGRSVVPVGTSAATVAVAGLAGVLAVAVVVEGVLLFRLLDRHGEVLDRLDDLESGERSPSPTVTSVPLSGLPVGEIAPEFSLPGLHGEIMTLQALRSRGRPVLLVFSSPTNAACQSLLPDIGRWQADHGDQLTIAVLSRGGVEENRLRVAEHLVTNVLLQHKSEVAELYRHHGTPNAVFIDVDGRIASPMVGGLPAIQGLVEEYLMPSRAEPDSRHEHPSGDARRERRGLDGVGPSPIGRVALPFTRPDLDGVDVSLTDFAGSPVLVAFWNPACGFCHQIQDEIRRLESTAIERGVPFLFVSGGEVEDNWAMDLQSTVLLDDDFAIGEAFGAQGTPSAIVIDADGLIASEMAIGGPAVVALADGITAAGTNWSAQSS